MTVANIAVTEDWQLHQLSASYVKAKNRVTPSSYVRQ